MEFKRLEENSTAPIRDIGARLLESEFLETPAFIYDEQSIRASVRQLAQQLNGLPVRMLFALKALSLAGVAMDMVGLVDGFAASSLFEAILGREAIGGGGSIHVTSPGFRREEISLIAEVCDYVTFNSIGQWQRFGSDIVGQTRCGLRINPQLSLVHDPRYDPCRRFSKLGVPIQDLLGLSAADPKQLDGVSGLLIHTNCDSTSFEPLLHTVRHLDAQIGNIIQRMEWVNLGGGYLFTEPVRLDEFYEAVNLLASKYAVEVFIEPGASLVRGAGWLVSTVLDLFRSDEKDIAILDTTVNHMPEVFEYQFEPIVRGHINGGSYNYLLAGCTCLAGDVFGEYSFDAPLETGSRVVFPEAGAYTLVKSHTFNGVNLPTIYALTPDDELVVKKRFHYAHFADRCGAETRAVV